MGKEKYGRGVYMFTKYTLFLQQQFYKNNEAQICPQIKNNITTIQAGIWNHKRKVYFS